VNQLTALPESISQLAALQELQLDVNLMTTSPESISQHTALLVRGSRSASWPRCRRAAASSRHCTGADLRDLLFTLSESIGQLTALQELRLEVNQLTTLPESIGQLTALQELQSVEYLMTTSPESIGQLTAL